MIGIDTNVLLRYVLGDDELQAKKAARSIQGNDTVFVSHVVLSETAWTLAGNKYRASAEDIASVIQALFEEETILIQDDHVVWAALAQFRQFAIEQSKAIDFPDCLIYCASVDTADYYEHRFNGFHTFDKAAQQLPKAVIPG